MFGNHMTRAVRGFQRTHEDRAHGYRRQIEDLIDEKRQHNAQNAAASGWYHLVDQDQLAAHRDTNEWARNTLDSFEAFFEQPDLNPYTLDAQFALLVGEYMDLLDAINERIANLDPVTAAGFEREASTPATEDPAALANDQQRQRTSLSPLLDSVRSSEEQRSRSGPLPIENRGSPAQASPRSHDHHRVAINDDPRRHYYTDQSADSSTTGRYSLITTDAYYASPAQQSVPATHRAVPIVQQLDFGDNTTPSASPPPQEDVLRRSPHDWCWDDGTTSGVMAYTDGNVASARPMAWHSPDIGTPAHVTVGSSDRSGPLPIGSAAPRRPTCPPPPPPSRPIVPNTSHPTTTNSTTSAGGRGPSSSLPSVPAVVDSSSQLLSATPSSGPPGPTATASTTEAYSDLESASAFYRKATFHRDIQSTSPLVLQDLSITPFDGSIRQYPAFRNRFLDVVEGHQKLPPRHKLQYLLQFLRGEPYRLANNFQLTDANYYAVINILEERYGDEDVIRNLLMADLMNLDSPSQTIPALREFHDEATRIVTDLKQLGDDVDANRFYEQALMSKLPPALKLELIKNSNYVAEKTTSAILTGIQKHTHDLELAANTGLLFAKLAVGNSCPPDKKSSSRPSSPRNAHHVPHAGYGAEAEEAPSAEPRSERQRCAFCGLSHWSVKCHVYRTASKRYNRAKQKGYCFFCLKGNHWKERCPLKSTEKCRYCPRPTQHHRALCSSQARSGKSPHRRPVSHQDPQAPGAPGGSSSGGPSAERHAPVKAVNWSDSKVESTARFVPPSAQHQGMRGSPGRETNSKKNHRKKKSKSPGTRSLGRKGTPRPTTASTVEDIPTEGVNACDCDRNLSAHQSLPTTVRCPTHDSPQHDRPDVGSDDVNFDQDPWADVLPEEDESLPESIGHCSDAAIGPSDVESDDYDLFLPYQEPTAYAVTAVNPSNGATREVAAFFDSGSNVSYVSTKLAADLDLPQQGRKRMRVHVFGTSEPLLMEGFATTLVLRSRRGPSVSLDATAAPDCIVKAVTTALVEDHELPALLKNEVSLISTRETPDILLGQDTFQLFQRGKPKRLPNGFDMIRTLLGPVIGGAGRVANPSKADTTIAFVVTGIEDLSDAQAASVPFPPPPPASKFSTMPFPPSNSKSDRQAQTTLGPLPESCLDAGLVDNSDAQIFGDFSYLENAGIGTSEMTPDDQAAADMLEKLITREPDGRYKVPLLFRTPDGEPPSNHDLPTNMNLGKGRGISTRNSLAKAPSKLAEYDNIIRDYKDRGFISPAPLKTRQTKHCLSHHPVHKETSTTTATRPVYDASAKLPAKTCLNDWLYRGPVLLPTVPAVLLRCRLPKIIVVCDIGKAFLQVAVKESHRDCLWFVWFKDPRKEPTDDNIVFYRFDRVPFGLKSSPYLLAGVIKKHLESEGTPLAHEMLKNCYVDNILLMADTVEEALQKYRESKSIFARAQMPLREYASNNAQFNAAVDPADRADLNKLRELGIRWDVTADYWDIPLRPKPPQPHLGPLPDATTVAASASGPLPIQKATATTSTPSKESGPLLTTNGPVLSKKTKRNRRKKADDGRFTKRSMLRFVAQIFDPLGLVQAAILLAKLVIQEVWKAEKDWDDEIAGDLARLWEEAVRDFDTTTIRIPRRITVGKVDSAEIHVFTDGSSQAYGFTAYLRTLDANGSYSTNLVYTRAKVKPIKDAEKFTIPRMELLGVLIGSRVIKFLHKELDINLTATYLWSDSTIVLHQVADTEKIKEVFIHNRLKEIRSIRDEFHVEFPHVPTEDNPADIVSRGLAAADLQHCEKWWHGAPFLAFDSSKWPKQPSSLTEARSSSSSQEPSEAYGSTAFATIYADVFIQDVSWRKLRRRKKPNPLDIITEPLPPTIYSVSAVAAITVASEARTWPPAGAAARPPPKLSSEPILPPVIGDAHFRWTEHVRITYYVLRAATIMLRGARQRLDPRRHAPALGFGLEDCLLESQPHRPSIQDLHITEMIILRKAHLRHPPSSDDRRNLGIFEPQGLLYVKGRLGNMKLRPTALTPIFLPRQASETAYIIIDYHRNNGHAGTNTTLANVRMRYWFTQGRRTIQKAVRAYCFEFRREAMQP